MQRRQPSEQRLIAAEAQGMGYGSLQPQGGWLPGLGVHPLESEGCMSDCFPESKK